MTRAILCTGKSGAGVSTIAAATALRCAETGRRTLLLHLGAQLGDEDGGASEGWQPTGAATQLTVTHTGAPGSEDMDWSPVDEWLQRFLQGRGSGALLLRLVDLPGLERLQGLLALTSLLESRSYDCVVVDCPPAVEMLDLLRLVEGVHLWHLRPRPPDHSLAMLARPLVSRLASIPDADAALTVLSDLGRRLARLHDLLADGSRSSFRLVSGGRAMDVAVLRHTYRALRLLEYPVDAIVLNRMSCAHGAAPQDHGILANDSAAPPFLNAAHQEADPLDTSALGRIADALYGESDAAAVLAASPRAILTGEGGRPILRVPAPITSQAGVGVTQAGDYVTVRVGPAQRVIPLPAALAGRICSEARLSGGVLSLYFL